MKQKIKAEIWKMRRQKTPNQNSKRKNESKKYEGNIRNLWENFKCTNIQVMGVPQEKRESRELKSYVKKKYMENFPNLVKDIDNRHTSPESK